MDVKHALRLHSLLGENACLHRLLGDTSCKSDVIKVYVASMFTMLSADINSIVLRRQS